MRHKRLWPALLCLLGLALGPLAGGAGAQVATYVPAPTLSTLPDVQAAIKQTTRGNLPTPIQGVPVATRCFPNTGTWSNGTDTGANFQTRHYVIYNTYGMRLVYYNPPTRPGYNGGANNGAAITQNPIVVTAAVGPHLGGSQYSSSSFGPANVDNVTWNGGQTSVTIQPGHFATSDYVAVQNGYTATSPPGTSPPTSYGAYVPTTVTGFLAAGDMFYVRTHVAASAAASDGVGEWPLETLPQYDEEEGSSHGTSEPDETQYTASQLTALTPAYAAGNTNGAWTYSGNTPPDATRLLWGPTCILGSPTAGTTAPYTLTLLGDSIMQGTGDVYEGNLDAAGTTAISRGYIDGSFNTQSYGSYNGIGAWTRACDMLQIPYINVSVSGVTFGLYQGASADQGVWPYLNASTHAIYEVGTNNLIGYSDGTSDANVAANVTSWAANPLAFIAEAKARGIKTILCTYLPRTSNETPAAYSHTYKAINNYIRANWQAMGASGYLDWATAVETQADFVTPVPLQTGLSTSSIGIYSSTAPQQALTDGGYWVKTTSTTNPTVLSTGTQATVEGTHPDPAGHTILRNYIVAHLPALLKQ